MTSSGTPLHRSHLLLPHQLLHRVVQQLLEQIVICLFQLLAKPLQLCDILSGQRITSLRFR